MEKIVLKMETKYLIVLAIVGVVLVSGCVETSGDVDIKVQTSDDGSESIVETPGKMTYTFSKEKTEGKLVVDTKDNTAVFDMTLYVPDEEDQEALYDITCGIWSLFFDKEALAEFESYATDPVGEVESTEGDQLDMKDFTYEKITLRFVDDEDRTDIVTCVITGYGEENIDLDYHR